MFACGVASMILFQLVVNIGMVIGLMPITGIPLPFITHGGASLISIAARPRDPPEHQHPADAAPSGERRVRRRARHLTAGCTTSRRWRRCGCSSRSWRPRSRVAILTRRWSLPTSVVLVVVGLVIALALPTLHVSSADLVRPELLLAIVLPGLVFEAAFRTDLATIRPAAPAILMLGIPGVVVVAGIVAILLSATTGISPGEAFLVGSMVAATDPAAVLATFRHLPVPARLGTLVEMESLVNDGTGIVLFALALDLLAGHGSLGGALVSFVVVVVGSTLLGAALGWAAVRLVGRVDEHVVELTITIVLAYGTYLLAETLGGSGVIATLVAAGASVPERAAR